MADTRYNASQIIALMKEAAGQGAKVLALPELCLTGYTCGDLFLQGTLLRGAEAGLAEILEATENLDMIAAVGLPVRDKWDGKLYNCAAVIHRGDLLGLAAKAYLPNYGEFYEQRWFSSSGGPRGLDHCVDLCGRQVNLSGGALFACAVWRIWPSAWRFVRTCGPRSLPPPLWPRRGGHDHFEPIRLQ